MAQMAIYLFDLNPQDRLLVSEAMTNASGFSYLMAGLITGATVVFSESFLQDLTQLKHVLNFYQPTVLCILTKLNHEISYDSDFSSHDFSSVRANITGGDKVLPSLVKDFTHKTNVPPYWGYGMSELIGITINKSHNPEKIGSVGTVVPSVKIRLLDTQNQIVSLGKIGEVWVSSPHMMLGYWNNLELTNESLVNGWLRTGDLAYYDKDGYYWHQGRIKNLIIREGDNISPLEVENVLMKHPSVKEAIVIGIADSKAGALPIAFIKPWPKHTVTAHELINFVNMHLEDYKVPVAVYFIEVWPLTKTNKIDRLALQM